MNLYADLHEPLLPIVRRLLANTPLPHTGRILDLACGDAAKWPIYQEIIGHNAQLLGIDWDRQLLSAFRSQFIDRGQLPAIIADAHQLPFRRACFDAAICVAALGLFSDLPRILAELRRVLRPNAPLLIFTAERRWAQVMYWTPALAMRLDVAAANISLPAATPDLIDDLAVVLQHSGFTNVTGRAFLLEQNLPPAAAELALLPWTNVRTLMAANLTKADLIACDTLQPEIDVCSIAVACVAM